MLIKLVLVIFILASAAVIGVTVTRPQTITKPAPTLSQEFAVSTDKTIYRPGEPITIKIKNSLRESIYLHKSELGVEFLEKKNGGTWDRLEVNCKYPECIHDIDAPSEIKPGEEASFTWEPKKVQVSTGIYRLNVSYQLREGSNTQDWNWQTIRSNEFVVK